MNRHSHSSSAQDDDPFAIRLRHLTHIDEEELCDFQRLCRDARQIRAKNELVRQRDQPARLHVLLEGWACRFKLLLDGRRQITSLLLPGEICDLDTLYVTTSDYTVCALTACSQYPMLAKVPVQALDQAVAARLWQVSEEIAGIGFPNRRSQSRTA